MHGNSTRILITTIYGDMAMREETQFIIFKGHDQYSITEVGTSSVKHAFMSEDKISGDHEVLLKLSRVVPLDQTLLTFVEKYAGRIIYVYENATPPSY